MPKGIYQRRQAPLLIRFWRIAKPAIGNLNECWIWPGSKNEKGYGKISAIGGRGGKHVYAHRASYEIFIGPIPEGLTIDHVKERGCTSKACFNPAHLEIVTQKENVLRSNSITAQEARQTHCKYGHPLSGDNLYIEPKRGARRCRICNKIKSAKRRAKEQE